MDLAHSFHVYSYVVSDVIYYYYYTFPILYFSAFSQQRHHQCHHLCSLNHVAVIFVPYTNGIRSYKNSSCKVNLHTHTYIILHTCYTRNMCTHKIFFNVSTSYLNHICSIDRVMASGRSEKNINLSCMLLC